MTKRRTRIALKANVVNGKEFYNQVELDRLSKGARHGYLCL